MGLLCQWVLPKQTGFSKLLDFFFNLRECSESSEKDRAVQTTEHRAWFITIKAFLLSLK